MLSVKFLPSEKKSFSPNQDSRAADSCLGAALVRHDLVDGNHALVDLPGLIEGQDQGQIVRVVACVYDFLLCGQASEWLQLCPEVQQALIENVRTPSKLFSSFIRQVLSLGCSHAYTSDICRAYSPLDSQVPIMLTRHLSFVLPEWLSQCNHPQS